MKGVTALDRFYGRQPFMDRCDRERLAREQGYEYASYGDQPTHGICLHGVIVSIDVDHHACTWTRLCKPVPS